MGGAFSLVVLVLLMVVWVILLFCTFRAPAPQPRQLICFLLLVIVTFVLGFMFLVRVVGYDPVPDQIRVAHRLSDERLIDLATVVPGVYHPSYIQRIDTDWEDEDVKEEWLVFYKYDVRTIENRNVQIGPYGGAIYDYDRCRPPVIHSFELVPVNYDYLGEHRVQVVVDNIVEYKDPLSLDRNAEEIDRPEVIISGISEPEVTDLNIFRKVGWDWECVPRRTVQITPHPEQVVTSPFTYENIGSFRGSYRVERSGATVVVKDRVGFERSQIVAYRIYTPKNGSYFQPQTEPEVGAGHSRLLVAPDEVGLAFGPGQPDETRQVYYPEKTVLAFFLQLGPNPDEALSYMCQGKGRSEYSPEDYGLTVPLDDLQKVIACEISYNPDVAGEQNHAPQRVKAKVVEVVTGGTKNCASAHQVECTVDAAPNPKVLPYGCEWCILECHPVP